LYSSFLGLHGGGDHAAFVAVPVFSGWMFAGLADGSTRSGDRECALAAAGG